MMFQCHVSFCHLVKLLYRTVLVKLVVPQIQFNNDFAHTFKGDKRFCILKSTSHRENKLVIIII